LSPCYIIEASNVDAFRTKQNIPRNLNQPNVDIAFEEYSNPSQKPYMGIAKKKNLTKKTPLSFFHICERRK
jgi:hypothetical protein